MWHDSRILEKFLLITWLMGVYIHICICYIQICVWYVLYMWAHTIYCIITLFYIFISAYRAIRGVPSGSMVKTPLQYRSHRRLRFSPWVGMILWRRAWELMPGEPQWIEEPSRLQSLCLQTVRHDWSDLAHRTHSGISLFFPLTLFQNFKNYIY